MPCAFFVGLCLPGDRCQSMTGRSWRKLPHSGLIRFMPSNREYACKCLGSCRSRIRPHCVRRRKHPKDLPFRVCTSLRDPVFIQLWFKHRRQRLLHQARKAQCEALVPGPLLAFPSASSAAESHIPTGTLVLCGLCVELSLFTLSELKIYPRVVRQTSALEGHGRRSRRSGGWWGDRTPGLRIANAALSQLS